VSWGVTGTEELHVPRVRYAYRSIYVTQHSFKQLVGKDAGCVIETEKAMICEDRSDPHMVRVHYTLVCKR
jgi:hypothetical protein